jgi:acetyl esterase
VLTKGTLTVMAQDAGKLGGSNIGRRRAAAAEGSRENYHDRRSEIVEAAVTLFRERGYHRTSLSDIAEAIGTERASLYYYFSSKEEILNEAVTPVVLRNTAIVEELRDSAEPVPAKLRRLIVGLLTSYAEHYPLLFLYLEENLSHVAESQEAWAAQMRAVNQRFEAALEEIIAHGVADGSLRALADPRILANGLMGTVSWTHRWFNPRHSSTGAAAIGEAYADLLLGGLVTGSSAAGSLAATAAAGDEPAWLAAAHPDVARVAARFDAAGVPPYQVLSVRQARDVMAGVTRLQAPEVPVARVRDLLVPGAAGQLPARVYHPAPGRRLPLLVYLHGGGWTAGGLTESDRPCRRLAAAGDCVVVAVEYRRAPETKFPGPLEDCVAAVRWLAGAAGADAVEADGSRVVLLGDSAGGNLVAATTLCLRDEGGPRLSAQVLLYPCLAAARTTAFGSYRQYADGPLMTRAEMEWFWGHYLRTEADEQDPRAAPLLAADLSGLPPALVVVAELDPLRDEGLAYAERLRAAGVPAESTVYRGAAHGFWWMDGEMRQAGELDEQLVRFLRMHCAAEA